MFVLISGILCFFKIALGIGWCLSKHLSLDRGKLTDKFGIGKLCLSTAVHLYLPFTVSYWSCSDLLGHVGEFVFNLVCWISVTCRKGEGKSCCCSGTACWPSMPLHSATSAFSLVLTTATTASCQSSPSLEGLLKKCCTLCLNATAYCTECARVTQ